MHKTFILTLCLFLGGIASAADYYVDNSTGNDSASGTEKSAPLKTLAAATKKLQAGDSLTILNKDGVYAESLRLLKITGTSEKPITIDGGGALLSGYAVIANSQWKKAEGGVYEFAMEKELAKHCRMRLRVNGEYAPYGQKGQELKEGEYELRDQLTIRFRPTGGSLPEKVEYCSKESGIQIAHGSYYRISNFIIEGFYNDGVNIHGNCKSIEVNNVESRYNGDDGFSAHEDATCIVRNSYFHHNSYGIQDILASQSMFFGCKIENNEVGVSFCGGYHSLVDCSITDNKKDQIILVHAGSADKAKDMGPLYSCLLFVRECLISGGNNGLVLQRGSEAMLVSSKIENTGTGVQLTPGTNLELSSSKISDCERYLIQGFEARVVETNNLYSKGKFGWDNKEYALTQLAELIKIWGNPESKSKAE